MKRPVATGRKTMDERAREVLRFWLEEAGPAAPVEVIGFSDVPNVGDELVEMDNERSAKKLSQERRDAQRQEKLSFPI